MFFRMDENALVSGDNSRWGWVSVRLLLVASVDVALTLSMSKKKFLMGLQVEVEVVVWSAIQLSQQAPRVKNQ